MSSVVSHTGHLILKPLLFWIQTSASLKLLRPLEHLIDHVSELVHFELKVQGLECNFPDLEPGS